MGRVRRRRNCWVIDFRLLGFSAANLSTDVHAPESDAPAAEPVTIRAADAVATGFAIPPLPRALDRSRPPGVRLDAARLETTLAETAAVAAVLADIFTADPPAHLPPAAGAAGEAARTIAGLDVPHASRARALAQRGTWRRADIVELARGLGLLSDGALEPINEAACERCGAPLCDGNDPLEVNPSVAQELVA